MLKAALRRQFAFHVGRLIVLGVWFLVTGASALAQPPFALRSISFPLIGSNYLDEQAGWTPLPTVIQEIKTLGANDVKVTISAGSFDRPTDNLPNPTVNLNPSDDKILAFLLQLKAAGFQVTLQPFVHVNFDPNGNLLDSVHAQPSDFAAWMAAHTDVMVRYAQLAQQAGANRYVVIGDEVQQLAYGSTNTLAWLNMVAQIRAAYSGQLASEFYADGTIFAGGNTHIDLIDRRIHDALDLIGVGWFPQPITNIDSPGLARLVAGWRNTVKGVDTVAFLQNVHARYNKPVWIADIAFHSFKGDNVRSSDIYNAQVPLVSDEQEQADEYESLFTILSLNTGPWFLGISCDSWNRFPLNYNLVARFLHSAYGENIRGKLAATTVQQWFSGQRGWGGMQANASSSGSNASLSVVANLVVSAADLGRSGSLYVAAVLPDGRLFALADGQWRPVTAASIPAYAAVALGNHSIPVLTGMDVSQFVGTALYVGYGTDLTDLLANMKYSVIYRIP